MTKKGIKVVSWILAVLLLAGAVINIYSMLVNPMTAVQILYHAGVVLTAFCGMFYVLVGCDKETGSIYFKWFMLIFTITMIVSLIVPHDYNDRQASFYLILRGITIASTAVLAFAKDFGYKRSLAAALFVFACGILSFFHSASGVELLVVYGSKATVLLLSIATLIMVIAKYFDKDERGRN